MYVSITGLCCKDEVYVCILISKVKVPIKHEVTFINLLLILLLSFWILYFIQTRFLNLKNVMKIY